MADNSIPYVRPGSVAQAAVDQVGEYFRTHPNPTPAELEKLVKDQIVSHGGDSVSASASAATVAELARRSPGQEQALAEHLVGVTLADPGQTAQSVAQDTRKAWAEAEAATPDGKIDKNDIAREQGRKALRDAGIGTESSGAFDAKFKEYLDQGVSPDLAAAAAVAAVLAQAMPQASGFSIFGYLTLLVHGNTSYVFKNDETIEVKGSVIHTHFDNTTYNLGSNVFQVDCDTIKTSGVGTEVRIHTGSTYGNYNLWYFSYATLSGSLFGYKHKTAGFSKTISGATYSGSLGRVYLAGLDSDVNLTKGTGSRNDRRVAPFVFYRYHRWKIKSILGKLK